MSEGRLFIVTAPSGAGKTSLLRELLNREGRLAVSISHTTRPMRQGEEDGVDYYFVSPEEFEQINGQDGFLECAEVFGNRYGTSRAEVKRLQNEGLDVILEIDWQGARLVRQKMPEAVGIFILPPSLAVLEARLRNRGTDDDDVVSQRLDQARSDILHCEDFEHCVINDDFEETVEQLCSLIQNPDQVDEDPRPCHERVLEIS
ncbi:MAG: guanylate kinase [Gammaproteobacteria bacterium]|nr:guanylate kinase [Gammaproteobacteria bacterium]